MPKHRNISGETCIKLLCNRFGFSKVRQKGSHVVLRKETSQGAIGTVVPLHNELKPGTLKGILQLAKVDEEEFFKVLE